MLESDFNYEENIWGSSNASIHLESKRHISLGLRRFLKIRHDKGARVLEVGCGTGIFLRSLKHYRPDLEAFGCDISKTAIDTAKENKEQNIYYEVADAHVLPYEERTFDIVVMMDVLEHLELIEVVLQQVKRVLKEKGVFYLLVPCEANKFTLHWLMWKLKIGHNLKKRYAGHIQRFTRKDIHKFIKDAGFKIIKETFSFHFIGQIYDIFFDYLPRIFQKNKIDDKQREDAFSVKDKISRSLKMRGIILTLWAILGHFVEIAAFYESQILKNFPLAIGVHITCRKGELI